MGILIVAMMLTGIVVGGTAVVLYRLVLLWIQSTAARDTVTIGFIAASLVCFPILFMPTVRFLWGTTVREGVNVARDAYFGIGPSLPPAASQITYYADYGGTDAVFSVSEQEFVAWTKEEGWKCTEIEYSRVARLWHLKMEPTITDGLAVRERFSPRGTGVNVIFDRTAGLCYYHYSSY